MLIHAKGEAHDDYLPGDVVWVDDGDGVFHLDSDDLLIMGDPYGNEHGEELKNVAIHRDASGRPESYEEGDAVWIDDVDLYSQDFTRRLDWDYSATLVGGISLIVDTNLPVQSSETLVLTPPDDLVAGGVGVMTVTRAGSDVLTELTVELKSLNTDYAVMLDESAVFPAGAHSVPVWVAGVRPNRDGVDFQATVTNRQTTTSPLGAYAFPIATTCPLVRK